MIGSKMNGVRSDENLADIRRRLEQVDSVLSRCMTQISESESLKSNYESLQLEHSEEKLSTEKLRGLSRDLEEERDSLKTENLVLQKVMDKISSDYEDLKILCDKVRHQNQDEILLSELNHCRVTLQEKEDKITALRKTTRALEAENSLLIYDKETLEQEVYHLREKLSDKDREISAKNIERSEFLERFQRLENEKLNVMREFTVLESELENKRDLLVKTSDENTKLSNDLGNSVDTLGALREGKKLVESKLQKVLTEKSYLDVQVASMTDRVSHLETALNSRETEMAEKISYYEEQISSMQNELDSRLDEITTSKDSDVESVKSRYIQLFHEKAEELGDLRHRHDKLQTDLESSRRKYVELERETSELQEQTSESLKRSLKRTSDLEADMDALKCRFTDMKNHSNLSLNRLQSRLINMHNLLTDKETLISKLFLDIEELKKLKLNLQQPPQLDDSFLNCSSSIDTSTTSSSSSSSMLPLTPPDESSKHSDPSSHSYESLSDNVQDDETTKEDSNKIRKKRRKK